MKKYTTGQFAKKANVTARTIRYYDKIGILTPSFVGENGYRYYLEDDLLRLQKILMLKELGFSLEEIAPLLTDTNINEFQKNLELQIQLVETKIKHLEILKDTLYSTCKYVENNQVNWNKITELINLTNIDQKIVEQYKSSFNLNVRINLHNQFSTNPIGWFNWIFQHIDFKNITRLLEIGSGNGQLWEDKKVNLRNRDIYLSDISQGMVSDLKKKLNNSRDFSYLVIDCESIPFKDGYFDAVVANHVLFYVKHLDIGLSEINRVLNENGRLYCTTYGSNHMKEITELVKEFDPRIELSNVVLYENFGLDNGEKILKKYFKYVEKIVYDDQLIVNDALSLVNYILSCHGNQNDYILEHYQEFIDFIENKINTLGSIKITKESGLFICKKI